MIRVAVCCWLLLAAWLHAAEVARTAPAITMTEIASPAAARALGASLATAPNGTLWLTWVEPGRNGFNTLRYSTLDAMSKKWRSARTISAGRQVAANATDFPQLVFNGDNEATAIWTNGRGGALFSESRDGTNWSKSLPWTGESAQVEMFSAVTLADGRALAVWLDGRGVKSGGRTQLYARIVGSTGPDILVDPSVCDCCPTALTAFPDGSAIVAYRGRTTDEIRDIRIARFRSRAWEEPRTINNDDWKINSCPVNGPQLASDGGRVAAAWFTAADGDPRVVAAYSPDAGARFIIPVRVDLGKPLGQADTLLLHDGTMLVTWLEQDGGFWLRRINPEFSAGEPFSLAAAGGGKVKGVPRTALLRDYAGGTSGAQFIAAHGSDDGRAGVRTILVTVPEGELLEAEKNCDCAPTPAELQGFPIRGTVTDSLPSPGTLRIRHAELPGIFPEGTREFRVAPEILTAVQPGRQFLGRVERRDGVWWLFDVRLIAETR